MSNIKVFGIDLAKNIFQVHGTDARGNCLLRKTMSRMKLIEFIANHPPAIIGIEACGGAHYWARLFKKYGHEVRMMSPQFVKPYVKSNKNDRNDAEAIAEACMRPNMRFVATKSTEQQDILSIHRARELAVSHKTSLSNQIRGLLLEYGIVIPKGVSAARRIMEFVDMNRDKCTHALYELLQELHQQYIAYDIRVKNYDNQLLALSKQSEVCKEIQKIPGIGPITSTAIVATIGDATAFKNGREVSAWLGMVPRQNSSGGKTSLGGISKRGDSYVRKLLIQGARTVVNICENKLDKNSHWVAKLKQRGGYNKAAVALANKNARVIWAIMSTGETYRQPKAVAA